ncbi:hypothetical protein SVIOM342S_08003 [Streptomyces violaceorubidus]
MFDFRVKRTTRHSRAYDPGSASNQAVGCGCDTGSGDERDGVAKVSIGLDAELVVEVMVLAGVGSPQDAVEAVVREDYIARGHRTETRTGLKDRGLREIDAKPQEPQGQEGPPRLTRSRRPRALRAPGPGRPCCGRRAHSLCRRVDDPDTALADPASLDARIVRDVVALDVRPEERRPAVVRLPPGWRSAAARPRPQQGGAR